MMGRSGAVAAVGGGGHRLRCARGWCSCSRGRRPRSGLWRRHRNKLRSQEGLQGQQEAQELGAGERTDEAEPLIDPVRRAHVALGWRAGCLWSASLLGDEVSVLVLMIYFYSRAHLFAWSRVLGWWGWFCLLRL